MACIGSQNLTGRLVTFEDYCLLQKDTLPIPKNQTLKWIGVTEEGVRLCLFLTYLDLTICASGTSNV